MTDPHAHIPTAEIMKDIADTRDEIITMRKELAALEQLPPGSQGYLMAQKLRIPYALDGIRQREKFIAKLEDIIEKRWVLQEQAK